jgi:hypothetical protein
LSFRQVGIPIALSLWLSGTAFMGLAAALGLFLKSESSLRQKLYWFGLPIGTGLLVGLLYIAGQTSDWWAIPWPVLVIGYLLLLVALLRQRQLSPNPPASIERPLWMLIWIAASFTLLVVIKNTLSTPQYQGRFFFPALGPISVLITAGWHNLLPRRTAPYLVQIIMVSFIIINLYVWFYQVIPIYYQPFLD